MDVILEVIVAPEQPLVVVQNPETPIQLVVEQGLSGKDGIGIPTGGLAGQTLVKKSGTNYDVEWATVSGSGGTTDHGLLIGLDDDDHPQYLTQARGDARYYTKTEVNTSLAGKSDTNHNHDSLYYTESEIDTKLAAKQDAGAYVLTTDPRLSDNRTPTAHTHDDRYYTETEVDAKLAGKQDAGNYVLTNDPRLSDSRTPTAHTHAIADVTGLQSALDGKADDAEITSLSGRVSTLEGFNKVLVLGPSDPVPGGTPAGTVILRTQ